MGKLYVTEYSDIAQTVRGPAQIGQENTGVVDQTPVTYTTTTQSAAFAATTVLVRIHTDSICSINFGTNPTATTNNRRLDAGATEYFGVPLGGSYKVAAVTNT